MVSLTLRGSSEFAGGQDFIVSLHFTPTFCTGAILWCNETVPPFV
jgi:hypothetical protein